MPKQLKFDENARRGLEAGVNKLADAGFTGPHESVLGREIEPVTRTQPFCRLGEDPPAIVGDCLVQRDRHRHSTAHRGEAGGNDAGVVEDQQIAWGQQVR